ncbi:MASE1 domain-containing protein [Oleiagrimonas sp. C23AA]|uniref:MASE1 domain-containing sensor histidine kinase n=1 Tax=Oleiagrimonas sp. C23AA TaxID=2719047 RepID=UPI001420FF74|nr:MASE1 domain-containing protein [Oleiagrimonas sp. C23AA]NII10413.1 sensor histidine kinase [Oleiagrimonas sp. C23AA]
MRIPRYLQGPLLAALYFLAWLALWPTTMPMWVLPAGLRFGLLLLTPMRLWPWLIAGEWGASALAEGITHAPRMAWQAFMAGDVPDVLIVALCLSVLRRLGLQASLRSPEAVARLLASALVTCTAVTLGGATIVKAMHPTLNLPRIANALGGDLLGEYLGVLLLAPVLIMLVRERPHRDTLTRLLLDGLLVLLPSMLVLLTLMQNTDPLPQFARILSLSPVLYFAFRHGWRGASLSMLVINGSMMLFADIMQRQPPPAEAHLFLAVAGTATLMLGAAIDALRRSSSRLAIQNARLEGANRRLDLLARQLSEAARRNLRLEEDQRRYMAAELHDELGQNLTAIQTRVKLAQNRLQDAGLADVATSINDILGHMRQAVRRLLDNLRPTVLDEFGLARALEEGPIADLLRSAGITYHFELHGDIRGLDEDTRTTIYRVAQEAATNAVRHAMAQTLSLRVRVGERHGTMLVLLDIRDDGVGLPETSTPRRGGRGLQSMRDRVTALSGIFRIRTVERGTRLHILLRANPRDSEGAVAGAFLS